MTLIPDARSRTGDDLELDVGYTAIIDGTTLSVDHRIALLRRGFTVEEIERNAYRSAPRSFADRNAVARRVHGVIPPDCKLPIISYDTKNGGWRLEPWDGLLIPVRTFKGRRIVGMRVRTEDADGKKYRWGSGAKARCHVAIPQTITDKRVWITEGELKADLAAERLGAVVISLPGVGIAHAEAADLCKQILENDMLPEVVIALDADVQRTREVLSAHHAVSKRFKAEGFEVYVAMWSEKDGKGLDDLLVANKQPSVSDYVLAELPVQAKSVPVVPVALEPPKQPLPARKDDDEDSVPPGLRGASWVTEGEAWSRVEDVMSEIWVASAGRKGHHAVALGFGGMLRKAGVDVRAAAESVRRVVERSGERDVADRVKAVEDSYEMAKPAGRTKIADVVGETLTEALFQNLRVWRRAVGLERRKTGVGDMIEAARPAKLIKLPLAGVGMNGNGTHADEFDLGGPKPGPEVADSTGLPPLPVIGPNTRHPAIDLILAWTVETDPNGGACGTSGPRISYREKMNAYTERGGRWLSSSSFVDLFDANVCAMLVDRAQELEWVQKKGSALEQAQAAAKVWREWSRRAFAKAMDRVPERLEVGGESREDAARKKHLLPKEIMRILGKQVPVNTPDNVVYYESVLDRAMSIESRRWLQVGQRGVYVRRRRMKPQIALRFDFLIDLAPDLAGEFGDQRLFGQVCLAARVGRPRRIRVAESEQIRVVILQSSFLRKLITFNEQAREAVEPIATAPAEDPERLEGRGDAWEPEAAQA